MYIESMPIIVFTDIKYKNQRNGDIRIYSENEKVTYKNGIPN